MWFCRRQSFKSSLQNRDRKAKQRAAAPLLMCKCDFPRLGDKKPPNSLTGKEIFIPLFSFSSPFPRPELLKKHPGKRRLAELLRSEYSSGLDTAASSKGKKRRKQRKPGTQQLPA